MHTHTMRAVSVALALMCLQGAAQAINGAQPGGNGAANASMGGASIALPLDAMAGANNPAGMAYVSNSFVLGAQVFRGNSSAEYVLPGNHLSNQQTIAAPELGGNWWISPSMSLGLTLSGAGSGSDYRSQILPVPGADVGKSTLRVGELASTLAWKASDELSLGVALRLVREQFEVQGLVAPAPVAGGLAPVPTHGEQSASGAGLRFGVLWKPSTQWTLGADFKPRTRMSRLNGYDQDVLAYSGGHLDVPQQYGVGAAWHPTDRLVFAADWLRIQWGDVKVNQDPNGFGWRNQTVVRIGASWKLDGPITLRAGYSRNSRQIQGDRVVENLLVPAINDKAVSGGLAWQFSPSTILNAGYEFDPRVTLQGSGASSGSSLTSKVQMLLISVEHRF